MMVHEWLACTDPITMLEFLEKRGIRARRFRLFAAACCRRAWFDVADARSRDGIATLERFADSSGRQADQAELKAASAAAKAAVEQTITGSRTYYVARTVAAAVALTQAWWTARWSAALWLTALGKDGKDGPSRSRQVVKTEKRRLADLIRDIVPNPFGPVTIPASCLTPTVVSIAQAAYEQRIMPSGELDLIRLAVLADALDEAGAPGELVAHLRGAGPHVRGCFALDLCLGLS